jgi:hypothetical protein
LRSSIDPDAARGEADGVDFAAPSAPCAQKIETLPLNPLLAPLPPPPPPQLCVPLPPFDGAMRSSSFAIWKRLRAGCAASGFVAFERGS